MTDLLYWLDSQIERVERDYKSLDDLEFKRVYILCFQLGAELIAYKKVRDFILNNAIKGDDKNGK